MRYLKSYENQESNWSLTALSLKQYFDNHPREIEYRGWVFNCNYNNLSWVKDNITLYITLLYNNYISVQITDIEGTNWRWDIPIFFGNSGKRFQTIYFEKISPSVIDTTEKVLEGVKFMKAIVKAYGEIIVSDIKFEGYFTRKWTINIMNGELRLNTEYINQIPVENFIKLYEHIKEKYSDDDDIVAGMEAGFLGESVEETKWDILRYIEKNPPTEIYKDWNFITSQSWTKGEWEIKINPCNTKIGFTLFKGTRWFWEWSENFQWFGPLSRKTGEFICKVHDAIDDVELALKTASLINSTVKVYGDINSTESYKILKIGENIDGDIIEWVSNRPRRFIKKWGQIKHNINIDDFDDYPIKKFIQLHDIIIDKYPGAEFLDDVLGQGFIGESFNHDEDCEDYYALVENLLKYMRTRLYEFKPVNGWTFGMDNANEIEWTKNDAKLWITPYSSPDCEYKSGYLVATCRFGHDERDINFIYELGDIPITSKEKDEFFTEYQSKIVPECIEWAEKLMKLDWVFRFILGKEKKADIGPFKIEREIVAVTNIQLYYSEPSNIYLIDSNKRKILLGDLNKDEANLLYDIMYDIYESEFSAKEHGFLGTPDM